MKLLLLLLVAGLLVNACDPTDRSAENAYIERHHAEEVQALATCTKAGGFIVRSSWDGRIIDCKVPR